MNQVRAICECRDKSETDLVVGVREEPLSKWGCVTWGFVVLGVLITAGGCLPLLGGFMLVGYLFFPKYGCQFCGRRISPNQFR